MNQTLTPMETLKSTSLLVKCPHCGNKFSPEEAIQHDLRAQLEGEFNERLRDNTRMLTDKIRNEEKERVQGQVQRLEEDGKAKALKLKELEGNALSVAEREKQLKEREERSELEMKKRLLEREKILKEQLEKNAMDKALLEVREREQKLTRDRETMELQLKKRVMEEAEKAREEEMIKNAELQKKLDDHVRLVNEMKRKSDQGSLQMQGEVQEIAIEEFLE